MPTREDTTSIRVSQIIASLKKRVSVTTDSG